MNNNQNLDLTKFEVLAETANGNLVGGFSGVLEGLSTANLSGTGNVLANCSTNNCSGGNCVAGCGSGTKEN